jgi:hypothetical protein
MLDRGLASTEDRSLMRRRAVFIVALGLCVLGVFTPIAAQRAGVFRGSSNDPAIRYTTATLSNPIVDVNKKLRDGTLRLIQSPSRTSPNTATASSFPLKLNPLQ